MAPAIVGVTMGFSYFRWFRTGVGHWRFAHDELRARGFLTAVASSAYAGFLKTLTPAELYPGAPGGSSHVRGAVSSGNGMVVSLGVWG